MGIDNPEDKKEVWTTPQTENKANNWRKNIPEQFKIIGISISAGNKIKELGDDKFEVLIKKLLQNETYAISLIGSKADIPRIDSLINKINSDRCFKATDFNLEELPSLMKKFSLYIAVDTGPIYIAHALGIPLIDIIGPVDPDEQPPQDEKSIRVMNRENIEPSSFVFKRRGTPKQIKKSLEATFVEDIYETAIKLLK
jgi:ADP-heptose:LPS heptosyltransferase